MRKQSSSRSGRALLPVVIAVAAIAALAAVFFYRRSRPPVPARLGSELLYFSIAPEPQQPLEERAPIARVRAHFFLRNLGTVEYRPERTKLRVMERYGSAVKAAPLDVEVELPEILPPAQQAQVVVSKPYMAEFLPLEEWQRLYPDITPIAPSKAGRYARFALPLTAALDAMKRLSLDIDGLLVRYDVIGEDSTRECTPIARAVLRRKAPGLSGFVVIDSASNLQIELPLR